MNDKKLVEASRKAVRIIIRRPHAYKFQTEHEGVPIPGLVVIDAGGKVVGHASLPSGEAVEKITKLLQGADSRR